MTPSTWNYWLGQEPGTASKRKRMQEKMQSTSESDASIFNDPTVDKTTSKTSAFISKERMDKNVSEEVQLSVAHDFYISKHRPGRTAKNVPVTVSEVGLLRYVRQGMGVESGTNVDTLMEGIASRQTPLYLSGFSEGNSVGVAKKLRSDCDVEELSTKTKQDEISSRCQLQPIHCLNLLNLSNNNGHDSVDPGSSPVSNHCTPIIHKYPFLNYQSLHKYSNPLTIVVSCDNKDTDGTMQHELILKYPNSPTLTLSSDDKDTLDDSTQFSSKETNLVPCQVSSLTSETSTSCEDLKNESSNTSTGKCTKIWRPFVDENCESRPSSSSSSGSTEIYAPVPHYVRLREEFKGYAMAISPLGVGVLRGSSTSSFRPVRRKRSHCNFCPMSFNNNGQLAGHMRIHTGDKPFKCDSCSKAFARNEELTRHKRIHSGLRPHVCDICSKKFGRKDHLNKHRKTHLKTSEKKIFHCLYQGCGHSYTRSDALTRHQSTAHNIRHSQQNFRHSGPRVREARSQIQKRQAVIVAP